MTALTAIRVEGRIVLASHELSLRDILRFERGAVVALGTSADAPSELHVNDVAVALGEIGIEGERTGFTVQRLAGRD